MIEFRQSGFLLALPALAALVYFTARPPRRFWTGTLRFTLLAILLAVLSGPVHTALREKPPHAIYLIDLSESIPAPLFQGLEQAIPADSDVLVFAGEVEPLTDRSLLRLRARETELRRSSEEKEIAEYTRLLAWKERLRTDQTHLPAALAAARARFREDRANSILLLSDGRDTTLSLRSAEIGDLHLFSPGFETRDGDVRLLSLQAPLVVHAGEPFDLRVEVDATSPAALSLTLTRNGRPDRQMEASVPSGVSTVILKNLQQKEGWTAGTHELRVHAQAEGDPEPRNNFSSTSVEVAGKPRILVIEGDAPMPERISRILSVQDMEVTRMPPSYLARTGADLAAFDTVVLAGLTPEKLSAEAVAPLEAFLSASGGGLLLLGTSSPSASVRDSTPAPLTKLLPVRFSPSPPPSGGDAPTGGPSSPPAPGSTGSVHQVQAPRIALLVLLDKSGSMAAGNNIALAREACLQAAEALSEHDVVGVIGFDLRPSWVAEFTKADRLDILRERVQRLFAGGGTNIQVAMEEAGRVLRNPALQPFGIRHILLVTDGLTPPADFEALVGRIRNEGTSVSTICIGSERFDLALLRQIATLGGGRFLFTDSFRNLPKLFVEEAEHLIGVARTGEQAPPLRLPESSGTPTGLPRGERAILPRISDPHDMVRGLPPDLPPLRGAWSGGLRETAVAPITDSKGGEPILAHWRYGLGRSAVWMSDLGGPWSPDWSEWPQTSQLMTQIVRYLSPSISARSLAGRVSIRRAPTGMEVVVSDAESDESLSLQRPTPHPAIRFERRQGVWSASVPLPTVGEIHPVHIVRTKGDAVERLSLGLSHDYAAEFDPRFGDRVSPLLPPDRVLPFDRLANFTPPARIESDRRDLSGWLLLAAILLLPIDVALRRLR